MLLTSTHTGAAYDSLAFAYDTMTADYPYERWLAGLEALALRHGLRGTRLLDVACGTGKSFEPLLARGYEVTGCDLSERMLAMAATRAPSARLLHVDMRELPCLGEFDLLTCIDDSLNYLLTEDDLAAALAGLRRNLAPHGLALWDVNTLAMYRSSFASDWVLERDGLFIAWRGATSPAIGPGDEALATIDVFSPTGGCWERSRSEHRQRHWPAARVMELAAEAGLQVLALHGQRRGAHIEGGLDELEHTKAVYVACRADRPHCGEVTA